MSPTLPIPLDAHNKAGGPAFPLIIDYGASGEAYYGMSLRDWFAGQALATSWVGSLSAASSMALRAYEVADAMLKAREEKPNG